MKKGIGPRKLGVPKTMARMNGPKAVAKQVDNKQDYYNLKPKDAITYADSAAVETAHFSNRGKALGEIAGKTASGGTFTGSGFTQGNTPNSADAKRFMKDNRALIKKTGGDYKNTYR